MESIDSAYAPVFRDGRIAFKIDLRVYKLSAVQLTSYRLAARCTAFLGAVCDHSLDVELGFPGSTSEVRALEVAREFYQELLDQELRQKIAEETTPLRHLILAHAYSRTGLPSGGRR